MVARRQRRQQHQRNRRQAGRRQHGPVSAFQRGHRFLQRLVGIQAVTPVSRHAIARGALLVQGGMGGGIGKAHGAGAYHWHVYRTRPALQFRRPGVHQPGLHLCVVEAHARTSWPGFIWVAL
ncbi:hypothetical protein G6F57_022153 [Rhizopus arrhizus]|nr:hypothetical protein G6F57_022153 [Rhizopus arrhizus]